MQCGESVGLKNVAERNVKPDHLPCPPLRDQIKKIDLVNTETPALHKHCVGCRIFNSPTL
jgi:hypothetical protein